MADITYVDARRPLSCAFVVRGCTGQNVNNLRFFFARLQRGYRDQDLDAMVTTLENIGEYINLNGLQSQNLHRGRA